jgi:ATP-dependent protease ClpP protease subunit
MLIHQLSSSSWGGKYRDMKDEVSNMDKFMIKIKEVYGKYTLIPERLIEEILDHDIWFSAEECLQHGLVDEII